MKPRLLARFPTRRQKALLLLALLLSWHLLWLYGLPPAAIAGLFVLLAIGYLFIGAGNALLLTFSLALFTGGFAIALKLTGLDRSMYYRPNEMLQVPDDDFIRVYQPNTRVQMRSPFSDIQANSPVGILEPRDIEWVTDALGFRNRTSYHGQRHVLVGDSFVAGEGNTQACTLTDLLQNQHGLDTYALGHPGAGLPEYDRYIRAFRQRHGSDFKVALFIYEENDFNPFEPLQHRPASLWQKYHQVLKDNPVYRYTRWMYARTFKPTNHDRPVMRRIAGQDYAFLPGYVKVVQNAHPLQEAEMRWLPVLRELRGQIGHIFFIPGKYRVLAPFLEQPETLPNAQWDYLERTARALDIPVTDLTGPLLAEQARQPTFWRADTHWNCAGTAAAARAVAGILALPPQGKQP